VNGVNAGDVGFNVEVSGSDLNPVIKVRRRAKIVIAAQARQTQRAQIIGQRRIARIAHVVQVVVAKKTVIGPAICVQKEYGQRHEEYAQRDLARSTYLCCA